MQNKSISLSLLAVVLIYSIGVTQNFPCSGDFIISIYQIGEAPTNSFEIDYDGTNVSFTPIVSTDVVFNGAGFNRLDNYIYAAQIYSNKIIRIKNDGNFEVVGEEPEIKEWASAAGDVNRNGIYALQEKSNFTLYFYDLSDDLKKVGQTNMSWHPSSGLSGPCELALDDFVFDPKDPNTIFSYQRAWASAGFPNQPVSSAGYLLSINADVASDEFGMVKLIAPIDDSIVIHIGGLFFNAKQELYGYGSVVPGPILEQKKLIRIDKETGLTSLVGIGPLTTGVDGCSCPYTISLEKQVKESIVSCADEFIHFEFTLINNAETSFTDLVFSDTFPKGMEIVEILPTNPLLSDPSPGTGLGTEILHYDNAFQAADSETEFTVKVKNPQQETFFCNQAFLGVPDDFGGTVLSDDPSTNVFSDSSCVQISVFDLQDALVEVKEPVNCSSEDDGALIIQSPLFHEGNSFVVCYAFNGLKEGPLEISANDGYLLIANLSPGEYTDIIIEALTDQQCSSAVPGVYALNVPLGLPIVNALGAEESCEGDSNLVFLNAIIGVEQANFYWTGPEGFVSSEQYVEFESAQADWSGMYHLAVEKDSCFVYDSVNLIINPMPKLEILPISAIDPCSPISLYLDSNSSIDSLIWSPAEHLNCSNCDRPQVLNYNNGPFSVKIVDENGCKNTASIDLDSELVKFNYIPNTFSPNGDGINDYFTVYGNCAIEKIAFLKVYDRWGNLLFENQNFQANTETEGWNGNLKGENVNLGIFVYVAEIVYLDGTTELLKGDVTLLR